MVVFLCVASVLFHAYHDPPTFFSVCVFASSVVLSYYSGLRIYEIVRPKFGTRLIGLVFGRLSCAVRGSSRYIAFGRGGSEVWSSQKLSGSTF